MKDAPRKLDELMQALKTERRDEPLDYARAYRRSLGAYGRADFVDFAHFDTGGGRTYAPTGRSL